MGHKIRQPREGQPRDLGSGSTSTGLNAAQKSVDNANEVGFHLILLVLAPPPPRICLPFSPRCGRCLPTSERASLGVARCPAPPARIRSTSRRGRGETAGETMKKMDPKLKL
jgi:hypothetical protein